MLVCIYFYASYITDTAYIAPVHCYILAAAIDVTQPAILRFFVRKCVRQHAELMGVKFDVEALSDCPVLHAKFFTYRCRDGYATKKTEGSTPLFSVGARPIWRRKRRNPTNDEIWGFSPLDENRVKTKFSMYKCRQWVYSTAHQIWLLSVGYK